MARIPTVTNDISARSGRTSAVPQGRQATAEAFGAGVGRGLQALGQGIDGVAQGLIAMEDRRREEDLANRVAQADFTRRELEIRNEVGADAAGYQQRTLDEYDSWVAEQADQIEDPRTRSEFVRRMQGQRPGVSSRAASYELGTAAEYSSDQANLSLSALDNRIRLQIEDYDTLVASGEAVINARGDVPAHVRAGMVDRWRQNSAMARFEGMMDAADTAADVQAIRSELEQEAWADVLRPQDLNRLLGMTETMEGSIRTAADAAARAAIDTLTERAGDVGTLIPQAELRAVAEVVAGSENPVTIARFARIERDQEIIRQYQGESPAVIRGAAAANQPQDGLRPDTREALSQAGQTHGVSLEYMTRVMGGGSGDAAQVSGVMTSDPQVYETVAAAWGAILGPGARIEVTSALRDGGSRTSQHFDGSAIDFAVYRADGTQIMWNDPEVAQAAAVAASMGMRGFGWGPTYMGGSHFHFDDGTNPNAPRNGVMVWSDDDGGAADRGPGAAQFAQMLRDAASDPSGVPRAGVSQGWLDRALDIPEVAEMAGDGAAPEQVVAAYASVARTALQDVLQRPPSDEELFMAHVLGIEEAAGVAAGYAAGVPEAQEAYLELVQSYARSGPNGGITATNYAQQQTMIDLAERAERELAVDPISHASRTGTFTFTDLGAEGGFEARGAEARRVADYYNIPIGEMQPFTETEAANFSTQFENGTADEILAMLTQVQQMGGDMARSGMSQLSEIDNVYAYAGGLQLETGQGAVAADIVRGQRRLDENPDIARQTGAGGQEISDAFMNATGGALLDANPAQRQAVMDAALAHYVETQVARGQAGRFDGDAFAQSVQAVLGGREGSPAMDTVNGGQTVMPPGVTGSDMEEALQNMTVADWTRMSETGTPPRYVTGEVADPRDLEDEARLRAIGGGRYRVVTSDGSFLITGQPAANGQLEPYIFVPTASAITRVNERAEERVQQRDNEIRQAAEAQQGAAPAALDQQTADVLAAQEDGTLTLEEQELLFQRYGPMWAYGSDGRRIEAIE